MAYDLHHDNFACCFMALFRYFFYVLERCSVLFWSAGCRHPPISVRVRWRRAANSPGVPHLTLYLVPLELTHAARGVGNVVYVTSGSFFGGGFVCRLLRLKKKCRPLCGWVGGAGEWMRILIRAHE